MQYVCIGGENVPRNKYPEETVQKILDVVKKKETLLLRMNFYQNSEKQIVCMEW